VINDLREAMRLGALERVFVDADGSTSRAALRSASIRRLSSKTAQWSSRCRSIRFVLREDRLGNADGPLQRNLAGAR